MRTFLKTTSDINKEDRNWKKDREENDEVGTKTEGEWWGKRGGGGVFVEEEINDQQSATRAGLLELRRAAVARPP